MNRMIKKIEWESNFFNLKIAEIDFSTSESYDIIDDEPNYDLIILKHNKNGIDVKGYTKTYEEVKVNFSKIITAKERTTSFDRILDTDIEPIKPEKLYNLAYLSGSQSRFKLDTNFGLSYFKKLYKTWVNNSIDKSFGFKVFYINNEEKIIAFVTLNKKDNKGQIGLIAVDKTYQGQGLGKLLINYVEYFCKKSSINELIIPTQRTNTSAIKFYEKLGYKIVDEIKIEHLWKNSV